MVKLEDIKAGAIIAGLEESGPVTIAAVTWVGSGDEAVLDIMYKDQDNVPGSMLVYRNMEDSLSLVQAGLPWTFDADAGHVRLASEAYRIRLAHLFDPYLAVHTSEVEPLPHQISAVYQELLPRYPLKYLLADDPGAGKTIMTGLFIKELIIRGDMDRCLIICPGGLAEQWQDELYQKFGLRFTIITNDLLESAVTRNALAENRFCIGRIDKFARDESVQDKLKSVYWDLIVVDEAHKMSASAFAGEVNYTKRYKLGQLLASRTDNFLLLTATPHNGKDADFEMFMSLLDPDRFAGAAHFKNERVDVSDLMRRLVKEDLRKFDGRPLFPERRATTVSYELSGLEMVLYTDVTEYVREQFERAERLNADRRVTVGFALTTLQRRLASSPEAIYQSLHRRRERLQARVEEIRLGKPEEQRYLPYGGDFDDDDMDAAALEGLEETITDQASAAMNVEEMEKEIQTLLELEASANRVRQSGKDKKWDELSALLQNKDMMFGEDGQREKIIIFTEHKDTLNYLAAKIRSLLGSQEAVVVIHGGVRRDERLQIQNLFRQDKDVRVLIATDAAGEGINLQRAHLMINYDMPWNPNRLEQRFGRIHRIGQKEVCHLWNLVAHQTREGAVYERLLQKLEAERGALNGKVFDILGKVSFGQNITLKDLMIEAIRYGNQPEVRARLQQRVDDAFDPVLIHELYEEDVLYCDRMDQSKVRAIREDMERAEAHKLQPHFIADFFLIAFAELNGEAKAREPGLYELKYVPSIIRNQYASTGGVDKVLKSYERICFDKQDRESADVQDAEFVSPGHPLLSASIDVITERYGSELRRGAVFIDPDENATEPRILFYIEDAIRDSLPDAAGNKRVISRNVHFVEINEKGEASNAGFAPYLDYQTPTEQEKQAALRYIKGQPWLTSGVEQKAMQYAVTNIIPAHLAEVKQRKLKNIDKVSRAVRKRLRAEADYWNTKSFELKQKEMDGKRNAKLNSQMAAARMEEFERRLELRMSQLDKESKITSSSPRIVGGALIIPRSLLSTAGDGVPAAVSADAQARKAIETAAMRAVMALEQSLGYSPTDVSASKCGYDVESRLPEMAELGRPSLRLIEVKGRAKGADEITVTHNEIAVAANKPDSHILAVVEVDEAGRTRTTYFRHVFRVAPHYAAINERLSLSKLLQNSDSIEHQTDWI